MRRNDRSSRFPCRNLTAGPQFSNLPGTAILSGGIVWAVSGKGSGPVQSFCAH